MNDKQNYTNFEGQELYGVILEKVTNAALLMLAVTFSLYLFGVMDPFIPTAELPNYWMLSLTDFMAASGAPTGWGWVNHLDKGDYINIAGIALLSGVSGMCYLVILLNGRLKKNGLMKVMLIAELFLITLAASNILSVGGH